MKFCMCRAPHRERENTGLSVMTLGRVFEVKQPHAKEYGRASRSWERQGMGCSLRFLETVQPCQHHDFVLLLL